MAAYIHHAAYYTGQLDWYVNFFDKVFGMTLERQRTGGEGLREVWLTGGIQLCELPQPCREDGRGAHLCLLVEDVESAREKALAMGCEAMEKHHWVRLPEGLAIELFPAVPGAIDALERLPKRAEKSF